MPAASQGEKRLLFVSNLFPDRREPVRGLDNATLLHALSAEWTIRVISPRPVFPPWNFVQPICRSEDEPFEPVFVPSPYLPRVGDRWNVRLMARALSPVLEKRVAAFNPDAVLSSWLYPDGAAVAELAERHQVPLILITQGTDTHHYLDFPRRRHKILSAIQRSEAVVCRSGDLAKRLEAAGADSGKLRVIYNGIDTEIFRNRDREPARRALALKTEEPLLLFVGNFLPVKDPLFLLRAHAELNRRRREAGEIPARLAMIGGGPLRRKMESEVASLGSESWTELHPRMPPKAIAQWMNAADALCLTSRNEGFPNVILEAMASGLPVVSTDVGGIHELLNDPARGHLVAPGDLDGYVAALEQCLRRIPVEPPSEPGPEAFAPGWDRAAREYTQVIESALPGMPGAC